MIFVDDDNTTPLLTPTSVPITFVPTKKVTNTKIEYEYKEHSYKCNAMETTPQQENIENIMKQEQQRNEMNKLKQQIEHKMVLFQIIQSIITRRKNIINYSKIQKY
eukprot:423579_1